MSDLHSHYRHITSDPEVANSMLWDANPDIAHCEAVLQRILSGYDTQGYYRWAIAQKEDDRLIGTISLLSFHESDSSCRFAYMLGTAYWNRGFMTEALEAVLNFAFEKMKLLRIEADHFATNLASGAVMRKAGMQYTQTIPEKYEKHGRKYDAVEYVITREMWENRYRKESLL